MMFILYSFRSSLKHDDYSAQLSYIMCILHSHRTSLKQVVFSEHVRYRTGLKQDVFSEHVRYRRSLKPDVYRAQLTGAGGRTIIFLNTPVSA